MELNQVVQAVDHGSRLGEGTRKTSGLPAKDERTSRPECQTGCWMDNVRHGAVMPMRNLTRIASDTTRMASDLQLDASVHLSNQLDYTIIDKTFILVSIFSNLYTKKE
jgi:hypothetical protein